MRVLALLREPSLATEELVSNLSLGMPRYGIQISTLEASEWMPKSTGLDIDPRVSQQLRSRGLDFDIVHAFGYRCAWACAEAYGSGEAWLFSAVDQPKTTHPELIKRLAKSQFGLCQNQGVLAKLKSAGVDSIEVVHPPVMPPAYVPDRASARSGAGLSEDDKAVCPSPDYQGPLPDLTGARWLQQEDRWHNYMAADLYWHAPGSNNLFLGEAMTMGCPPLIVEGEAFEYVEPYVNGFTYPSADRAADVIAELIGMPLTVESLSYAAKLRGKDLFGSETVCDRLSAIYYEIGSRAD